MGIALPMYGLCLAHAQQSSWLSIPRQFITAILPTFLLILSTVIVQAQDISIFQPMDGPTAPKYNDGQGIALGIKFRSTQDGFIKGIRYYKANGITGTHTGQLYSSNGTLLAQVVFYGETALGWQQALFAHPVAITANTTYIAAYHNTSGDYAATNGYFSQSVINGPLRALASGEEGLNGIYGYSSSPVFPANGSNGGNYWVDVVFNSSNDPDMAPPVVNYTSPGNGANDIATQTTITAAFNEWIDASTATASSCQLNDASGTMIPATVNATGNQITLTPAAALVNASVYHVTVKGGATGVKDLAGNALTADYTWSFTTAAIPAPDGPGGPILVISNVNNPFSRYTTEILKAEGLNEFLAKDISQVTAAELDNYDIIILGEMSVTPAQAAMFTNWVNAGGTFIAFRPAVELSSLLGITKLNGTSPDRYLKINAAGPGLGIINETIQYHGASDIYNLNGATALASLYIDASTAMPYPAVTARGVGSNGGQAIAFTYDLARSIVYMRQGNPAWAGHKRDGTTGPVRSDDMFFGTDTPDWVDFNKITIPQADEQQHLLTNIILQSNFHRKPLPRFWFLPSGHKAAIVMTGDDHSFNGTTGQFNYFMTQGPNSPGDVANWKAIRGTSYIYNGTLTNAQATAFEQQGFEIALHVNTNCNDFTGAQLQDDITSQMALFRSVLPGVSPCVSNRNHCVAWSDWASVAKVQAANGIRFDVNYYYWPAAWVQNRPGMFTGSGMPMKFADLDGTVIDCYQATTQLSDEAQIDYSYFANALLDKAQGPEGYYGVFTANMHTDSSVHSGANAIIAAALAHQVPVISARQLLTWLDGRNSSSFGDMVWNNGRLQFTITAAEGATNLRAMVPVQSAYGPLLSITGDDNALTYDVQTIKGINYAFFSPLPGTASYVASYNALPIITTHPVSVTVCEGEQASFKSAATGSPVPTVQWQVSADHGVTWTTINGATGNALTVTATTANNQYQYRAVWANSQGSSISHVALLTVNAIPVLNSNLSATATSGELFIYTPTSATPGTVFNWSRVAVAGISNSTTNGQGPVAETLYNISGAIVNLNYVYTLTANGCSNTQAVTVAVNPPVACSVNTGIVSNFNNNSIRAGRYIWFNSIFDPSGLGSTQSVNFYVRNSRITYTVNNQLVTLNVPDAHIRFEATISVPSTVFVNGSWESAAPLNYNGNVFMSGLSYPVPVNLPASISNIRWVADISTDKAGVSLNWKWAAAVYTNFAGNAGLSVKTTDGPIELLGINITDKAATPLNYKAYVVAGGTGGGILSIGLINVGLLNYTGNYSTAATVLCTGQANLAGKGVTEPAEIAIALAGKTAVSVQAMPNPSAAGFDVVLNGTADNIIAMRITDISGRMVEQYPKLTPGTRLHIGEMWKAGTYIVEILQAGERKMIKLVKL